MIGFSPLASASRRFRRAGADFPFGDPRAYHGVALEGYFWRITLPRSRAVLIVMASVNRDSTGAQWGTVGLAAHPSGLTRAALADTAHGATRGIGLQIADAGETLLEASEEQLTVRLGTDLRLHARFEERVMWPRRSLGGVGVAHLIPGLSQYWHPHMLGATTVGTATLGGQELSLAGASAYAEKNWGPDGFPSDWWWGQAHGFERPDICAAFAGGVVGRGALTMKATAVVVRVGTTIISAAHPFQPVRARLDEGRWDLTARAGGYAIQIRGWRNGSDAHSLPVPVAGERRQHPDAALQHLAADMHLTVRRRSETLFAGRSALAGLERGHAPISRREAGAFGSKNRSVDDLVDRSGT